MRTTYSFLSLPMTRFSSNLYIIEDNFKYLVTYHFSDGNEVKKKIHLEVREQEEAFTHG